jgi:hypothetical protein
MRIFQPTITGSIAMTGSLSVTGSITSNLLTVVSGGSTEFSVTGTGVTIGNVITDTHTVTGSLNISGSTTATSFTGSLSGTATTASFITTANLAILPTALSYTAPVASILSGGSAAETTIQTLTVPGGVYKSGDNILLTVWGLRTTGAATGVNSTLTVRLTNISGTTINTSLTGNRNHNYTLTARVLSDTSILWYGGAVAAAAIATTVTSVSGSGFTLNFSVTRDVNTSEFTLYNAIIRKYN